MKNRRLSFVCLLLTQVLAQTCFGQIKVERATIGDSSYLVYPVRKHLAPSGYSNIFEIGIRYVQLPDKSLKRVSDEEFQPKPEGFDLDVGNTSREKQPWHHYSAGIPDAEEDIIDPIFDSLPDGDYVQFYDPAPYVDGDTLKYHTALPAAFFSMQNNLFEGPARLIDPAGKTQIWGAFHQGLKTGNWKFDFVVYMFCLNKKRETYACQMPGMLISQDYLNGKRNGERTVEQRGWVPSGLKEFSQWTNDTVNGRYEVYEHGELLIKGAYSMNREVGEWFRYEFTKDKKPKKVLRRHYTIAANPKPAEGIIIRSRYLPERLKGPVTYRMKTRNAYEPFDYKNDYQTDDNFAVFYRIPLADSFEVSKNTYYYRSPDFDPKFIDPYLFWHNNFTDGTGKSFERNQLLRNVGYVMKYEGLYEEYYHNGQLRMQFRVEDGYLSSEPIIYYDNGQMMNKVEHNPMGDGYEERFFDRDGEMIEISYYDDDGILEKSKQIFGYSNGGMNYEKKGDQLVYERPTDEQFAIGNDYQIFLKHVLDRSDKHLIEFITYYPRNRTLATYKEFSPGQTVSKTYVFNSAFDSCTVHQKGHYKGLIFEYSDTIDMNYDGNYEYRRNRINKDTMQVSFLLFPTRISIGGLPQVTEFGVRFSGKLKLDIPDPDLLLRTDSYLSQLFPDYRRVLRENESVYGTIVANALIRDPKRRDWLKKRFYAQTLELSFSNGQYSGAQHLKNKKGDDLMTMRFKDGKLHGDQQWYCGFGEEMLRFSLTDDSLRYNHIVTQENQYQNGLAHGHFREMDINGKLRSEINCVNDKAEGPSIYVTTENENETGGISGEPNVYTDKVYIQYYVNNVKNGPYRVLRLPDSLPLLEANYVNGLVEGPVTLKWADGQHTIKTHFTNGWWTDSLTHFDADGQAYLVVEFDGMYVKREKHYRDGVLNYSSEYNLSDRVGCFLGNGHRSNVIDQLHPDYPKPVSISYHVPNYHRQYDANGQLVREGLLKNGLETGTWLYHTPIGEYRVRYVDSIFMVNSVKFRINGVLETLNEKHQVTSRRLIIGWENHYSCTDHDHYFTRAFYTTFESDTSMHLRNGWTKNYFDNGVLQSEGPSTAGMPNGIWKFYNPDATLKTIGGYVNGQKDGKWVSGDITDVKYTGDQCTPDKISFFQEYIYGLQEKLSIVVVTYEMGQAMKREEYNTSYRKQ